MIVADQITPDYGFQGGPTFSTIRTSLKNGEVIKRAARTRAIHKLSAAFTSLTRDQYLYLKAIYLQCLGGAGSFLMRDWLDYEAIDEPFGTGDGSTKTFQLAKISALDGEIPYRRDIYRPEPGAIIKVAGTITAASVSGDDGSVVFATAPANGAALTWSGKFWLCVEFSNDDLTATVSDAYDNAGARRVDGSVDLMEVLPHAAYGF